MAKVGGRVAVPDVERLARGERLKMLRKRIDFTQDALGERGGFPRADMSRFEKGEKLSSESNRRKLSQAFGVSLETLAGYIDGELGIDDVLRARENRMVTAAVMGDIVKKTVVVEEPRYPSLEDVIGASEHKGRWSNPAIAAARSMALDSDTDVDAKAWTQMLDRLDAAIAVSVPKLRSRGVDPLAGVDDRVRPARKKR